MKSVTDDTFAAEVVESGIPVLVDFWAEWCQPCKQLAPVLEQLSAEYEGRVAFVKVNVEEEPGAPTKYGVRNLPTLVLFKDGAPIATTVGGRTKGALDSWLKGLIAG